VGQPYYLAGTTHLGLWGQASGDPAGLPLAVRLGRGKPLLDGTTRTACRRIARGGCPGAAHAFKPDTGQRPSGHFAHERARRPCAGSALGHRSNAQGNCIRQAGRGFL